MQTHPQLPTSLLSCIVGYPWLEVHSHRAALSHALALMPCSRCCCLAIGAAALQRVLLPLWRAHFSPILCDGTTQLNTTFCTGAANPLYISSPLKCCSFAWSKAWLCTEHSNNTWGLPSPLPQSTEGEAGGWVDCADTPSGCRCHLAKQSHRKTLSCMLPSSPSGTSGHL